MKKLFYLSLFLVFMSCASDKKETTELKEANEQKQAAKIKKIKDSKLNISVFLDLSDRIDTIKYSNKAMQFYKRDIGYIANIANSFANAISFKKSRNLDDNLQIYFDPEPSNPTINKITNSLKVNINRENGTIDYIKSIPGFYEKNIKEIYEQALLDRNYVGSDVWGFFKNRVVDNCIDSSKRNILVILTDGYIYHKDSKRNDKNLSSYLTPQSIRNNKLTSNNWEELIASKNYGFIPLDIDLSDIEILVLGVNPSEKNKYDDEVIKKYWSNWLAAMGVKKYAIKNSYLPSDLEKVIDNFIAK